MKKMPKKTISINKKSQKKILKIKIQKKEREGEKKINPYNQLQKILGKYGKDAGIKFGKDFSKICSKINLKTKGFPLKFIEQNIEMLYLDVVGKPVDEGFPESFPFYRLEEMLNMPMFDNVMISYTFDDGFEKYDATGLAQDVMDEFKLQCYRYLRNNYDSSDNMATFHLEDTDKKTFVKYQIKVGDLIVQSELPPEPTETSQDSISPQGKGISSEADKLIQLEREKQKTLKEQQKTMSKMLKLLDKGYSKDEINKLLGL